jgi:RNA polymerase sigma factor (sigma-70 family)
VVVLDPEHAPDVLSDASLVADAQRGSTAAFAELYERHHDGIVRHSPGRIGANDAADAAQETFLRAWRAIDGFGGEQRVYPWLRTIATNVCIDILRRRSRSVPVAELDGAPVVEEIDLTAVAVHVSAMTEALARLSDRHRSVLQLREYEGWTYERIADHEHLDLSAVKSLLWRARQSLRREFLVVSAQGRLSALAGILSLGRLRDLLAQLAGGPAAVGASSAAVAAVAAAVAVPVMAGGPAPTVPAVATPPVQVAAAPRPPASHPARRVVARAGGGRAALVVTVAASVPAPTAGTATVLVAHDVTPTSSTVPSSPEAVAVAPAVAAPATVAGGTARVQAKVDREAAQAAADAVRAQAKADRQAAQAAADAARAQAKDERVAAQAAADAARAQAKADRQAAQAAADAARAQAKAERQAAKAGHDGGAAVDAGADVQAATSDAVDAAATAPATSDAEHAGHGAGGDGHDD